MSASPVFQLDRTELEPGTSLIEASAGTGKTFTIAGLFLRLLLERGLAVNQVLVVTYTVAATEELRGRIRQTLADALRAFETGASPVPFLQAQVEQFAGERPAKIRLLDQALHGFDEAPIYTIHGFCQRTLTDRAFESGGLFDTELLTDASGLLREVVEDFWRRRVQTAGRIAAAFAVQAGGSPEQLLQFLKDCLPHAGLEVLSPVAGQSLESLATELETAFAAAREIWQEDAARIRASFGAPAKWAKSPYNRDPEMARHFHRLVAVFAQEDLSATSLESLEQFTTSAIRDGTRAKSTAPALPFFAACEAVTQAAERFRIGLRVEALRAVEAELPRRKTALKVQTFDDLLRQLDAALPDPDGGALGAALRAQYPAALIDEFQDTDPVQYRIFRRLFAPAGGAPANFLFLIGDPKQAIYGFRGADVFTYLAAQRDATQRYTLAENWRSERGLVAATNALFAANPAPFVFPEIAFAPVEARGEADARPLRLGGRREPPFQIWFEPRSEGDITKTAAEAALPDVVAAEIGRLVAGEATLGDRRLLPEDIAVLVPENRQAQLMQDALGRAGIPSVQLTTGSLFATRDATEVKHLLAAIAEPASERLVRAALAADLIGQSAGDLQRLAADANAWAAVLDRFRGYLEAWTSRGFIPMFRALLQREGVRRRLLRLPDGERRLTNVLHLGEVLQQADAERHLGVSGLLQWIVEQEQSRDGAAEEHQLRLERDERAVKLVTIHKSKGLEYPVVFCPFSWRGSEIDRGGEEAVFFHDDATGRLRRDLGSEQLAAHAARARIERLAENVRQFYVALTRAKHRAYFVWGGFRGAATSAPAWLLHPPPAPTADEVAALSDRWPKLGDAHLRADLARLSTVAEGAIEVRDLPPPATAQVALPAPVGPPLQARGFTGTLQRDWRVTSFSALTAGSEDERPDYDSAPPAAIEPETPATSIFAFPRGVKAGTCLHAIFERLDFARWNTAAGRAVVDETLRAHGLAPELFGDAVAAMVGRVLTTPLPTAALAEIPAARRLTELEFCFPLGRLTPGPLRDLLARHGAFGDSAADAGRIHFNPVTGALKGFMDLVFEWQGRFWIVDWKSNWLGNRVEDYGVAALRAEIQRHQYFLQYQLYTVALERYLRLRAPGYDYERDFGGVFYVFLRGIDPARPDAGVFHDRPDGALVRELADLLTGEGGQS